MRVVEGPNMASASTSRLAGVASASGLSLANSASTSTFEGFLPSNAVDLEVRLERGRRNVLDSDAATTLRTSGGRSAKTYSAKVVPGGHVESTKKLMRYSAPGQGHADCQVPLSRPGTSSIMMDTVVSENLARTAFRMERLKKFNLHRFMPVLVNPLLLPSWRTAAGTESEVSAIMRVQREAREAPPHAPKQPRQRRGKRGHPLVTSITPTVSQALKQEQKKQDSDAMFWHPIYEASQPVRVNTSFEQYDCVRQQERKDLDIARSKCISSEKWQLPGNSVVPRPGTVPPPFASDPDIDVAEEVAEARRIGKENFAKLRESYQRKRERFKQERDEQGALSSFELAWQEHKTRSNFAQSHREEHRDDLVSMFQQSNKNRDGATALGPFSYQNSASLRTKFRLVADA